MNLDRLKPSGADVRLVAIREASIEHWPKFAPICFGFMGNLALLTLVTLAAFPFVLLKGVRELGSRVLQRGGNR